MKDESTCKYYYIISTIFILCLLLSNVAAMKLCNFFDIAQIDAGTITFPLLYILNDVLTEIYGFSASRKTIIAALICNVFFSGFLYLVTLLPSTDLESAGCFNAVFALSPIIVVASITSYSIGELVNSSILSALKSRFQGKFFIYRAIFSTLVGASLETTIFCIIAFSSVVDNHELLKMIMLLTALKVLYEAFTMPITSRVVDKLKRRVSV